MRGYRPRAATVADLPLILRAEREYIAAVEPEQMPSWTAAIDRNLALWIDNLQRTTVVDADCADGSATGGAACGFVMWTPDVAARPGTGPAATLITIQVLPDHRRQGLGRSLLDLFAQQAEAAGATTLRLGVHESNPARALYPSAGYHLVGRDGDYLLYELST